ncbi:MAG: hypothetical protein JW781_03585 [Deltaproteobacteria bacterium]|nr:hypothetical protein [Candidatus Anaeroferrophillacea bacterium]
MPLYFPRRFVGTGYHRRYRALAPADRVRLLREFVGVTYERRFVFIGKNKNKQRFRDNINRAAEQLECQLRVGWLVWRHRDQRFPYLNLIFRHYLFGFLVQLVRGRRFSNLPVSCAECYPATPVHLAVLRWMNRYRDRWEPLVRDAVGRAADAGLRDLYLYCLAAVEIGRQVFDRESMAAVVDEIATCPTGGRTPLGVEMEFSNLGKYATIDKRSRGRVAGDPFRNMEYYSGYRLADVTWRLGGYVDTHVRGRRLFTLSRFGGFFEYPLVRVDYPRSYSLPLTRDAGIAAAMIGEVVEFVREIEPHSLHVNLEHRGRGDLRPERDDYLCLLMLGGDLGPDERGRIVERRMAGNELRGVIQRRRHLSLFDETRKDVVEYSFGRLWKPGTRPYSYQSLLMALKGFQHAYDLDLSCRDQVQPMLYWAQNPRPLPAAAIDRFSVAVQRGLEREGGYDIGTIRTAGGRIRDALEYWNSWLVRVRPAP